MGGHGEAIISAAICFRGGRAATRCRRALAMGSADGRIYMLIIMQLNMDYTFVLQHVAVI